MSSVDTLDVLFKCLVYMSIDLKLRTLSVKCPGLQLSCGRRRAGNKGGWEPRISKEKLFPPGLFQMLLMLLLELSLPLLLLLLLCVFNHVLIRGHDEPLS